LMIPFIMTNDIPPPSICAIAIGLALPSRCECSDLDMGHRENADRMTPDQA
jgi:hypothetical protein